MATLINKEKRNGVLDLKNYHVDLETGFMLRERLESLPVYFEPWNKLASNIPALVRERKFRDEVYKLPLLDHSLLTGYQQLRLAHLQLSFIASAFVWQNGEKEAARVLPKCVAVPFCRVSEKVGLPPIMGHASLVLTNWDLKDPTGSYELEILEEVKRMQESGAGSLTDESTLTVAQHLDILRDHITQVQRALSRMHDKLTAKTFFNVLRPFLSGWGGEGNPLPEGLIYEGISESPIKMTGGSAAQSSTMQVLDAFLGVQHTEEKRTFLVHMRDFMPPEHKRLIEDLEQWPHKLRDVVLSSRSSILKQSYNNCISNLVDFRTYHMQIVTKYIITASREINEGNYESLDNKGTGGTSLIPFLKVIRSDTEEKLVSDKNGNNNSSSSSSNNGKSSNLHIPSSGSKQRVARPVSSYHSVFLLLTAMASTLAVGLLVKSVQH